MYTSMHPTLLELVLLIHFLYLTIRYAPMAWIQGLVKYKFSDLPTNFMIYDPQKLHDICMSGHNLVLVSPTV
jgi:hypothetical protein